MPSGDDDEMDGIFRRTNDMHPARVSDSGWRRIDDAVSGGAGHLESCMPHLPEAAAFKSFLAVIPGMGFPDIGCLGNI